MKVHHRFPRRIDGGFLASRKGDFFGDRMKEEKGKRKQKRC